MTPDSDPIAEQYKRSKQTPSRTDVECVTLLNTIGSVKGLSVLDVACGEGFYTRLLRHQGAARSTSPRRRPTGGNGSFAIENYSLSVRTHEESLRQAGFRTITWHEPRVSPEGQTRTAPPSGRPS